MERLVACQVLYFVTINCTTLFLLLEVLCHSNCKFRSVLIIEACEEKKALIVTTGWCHYYYAQDP